MCSAMFPETLLKAASALDQQGAPVDFGNDSLGHCSVLHEKLPGPQSCTAVAWVGYLTLEMNYKT